MYVDKESAKYIDSNGDLNLTKFLHSVIWDLMKYALDTGTMLSEDESKLRAFKEQTRNTFKGKWSELLDTLMAFDLVTPCSCSPDEYCEICGGTRFVLPAYASPDKIREVASFVSDGKLSERKAEELEQKLQEVINMQDQGLL